MHLLEVIVPTAMSSFALGIIVGANIMNCNGFKKSKKRRKRKMGKLFSPSWWVSMFINTFVTMIFIYLIKKVLISIIFRL